MKPYPWRCGTCRERGVAPERLATYSAEVEHDGHIYSLELADLPVLRCGHCGTIILGDAANAAVSDGLRTAAGILRPDQIRRRRDEAGLTRGELAALMQVSEATLGRWEDGDQIQGRAMDRFLHAVLDVPELRRYLQTSL